MKQSRSASTLQRKTRSIAMRYAGGGKSKDVWRRGTQKRIYVKRSAIEDEAKREAEEAAKREGKRKHVKKLKSQVP
ncbi:hypothetical protein OH492_04695 [Vibrio chagasii]|nr:hypothetical protein [Vibrio chagasii]